VAQVRASQGDHAGTVRAAEDYVRASPHKARDSVTAAEAFVRFRLMAETDPRLSSADGQATAWEYVARAAALLEEGIEAAGDDPQALNAIAWFLANGPDFQMRNPARAVELARKAVAIAPRVPAAWYTLGVAEYRAGGWNKAIDAFSKSTELASDDSAKDALVAAGGWFFLAMAHWQKGDRDKARSWYDKTVRWMEKNKPKDDELRRFGAEAAALLGVTNYPTAASKKEQNPKQTSRP
jgi:tetratricopeptide (TPR) repeat protein